MLPQAGRPRERFVMSRERSANHNGINKGVGIVKRAFRVLSMTVVVGLLAAAFGVAGVFAQSSEVEEGKVEWTSSDGAADVTFVSPGDDGETVTFFIRDDIAPINNGKATWSALPAEVTLATELNIVDGTVGMATSTDPGFELDAEGYDQANPVNTPIDVASVHPSGIATASGTPGKVITLVPAAAGSPYEVRFTFDVADSFTGDKSRARVTSRSDPQGELVTIAETGPTTELYKGQVMISGDGATRGADEDGVYVQDGDTLTVTYLDKDGSAVDSDDITVDAQAPTVSSISPDDGFRTNDTRSAVRFTVTDTGSSIGIEDLTSNITLMINNEPANLRGSFLAAPDGYEVRFSQTTKWTDPKVDGGFGVRDGEEFLIQIMATDDAGNTTTVDDRKMTIDITAPEVTGVETGGKATNVRVSFTEDLDEDSISADDFRVDGSAPDDAELVELGEDDDKTTNTVDLTVASLDSDAAPKVEIAKGQIDDVAGNGNAKYSDTANDGIAPTLGSVVVDTPLAKEKDKVKVTLSSNEKLATVGVIVSINGPSDDDTISGMKTASSTQPLEYAATVTVGSGTETGKYGVSIQVTDVAQNSSDNLTEMKDEEVTVDADDMVKVSETPIGDSNFDGTVDNDDVTVPDGMTAGAVDASAGTIVVNGAAEGDEIKVTYKYVKGATFEVDHDAPTISFTPDGEKDIENTAPYIRVTFDEDEYKGDSYTESWLTDALLTGSDGEETDILDQFQTGDNKNYLWAASGLALGSHSLEIKGEDDNGNSATATLEFKITARSKVKVALVPGLNLISLPGVPADTAIDAVITNPDIEFVSTYDPRSPEGFQSAVRGPGGTFGSGQTLSIIDGSKAYWVSTTSYASLEVDIPGYGGDAAAPPPVFRLAAGWNLVAVVAVNPATKEVDADEYLSGLKWSRGYGYNNDALPPALEGFTPDTDEMLTVGTGYWVYLTEAGDLVP